MTEKRNLNKVAKLKEPGMLSDLSKQARLILSLLRDRRVSLFAKLLPIGSLIYLVSPDLFPFILDDAVMIGFATYFFTDLCPAEVVEEHRLAIWGVSAPNVDQAKEIILEAEFKEQDQD